MGFSGRATEEVAPDTSCVLPSKGLSRRKPKGPFHNRKSGPADTERSRSGVQKKKGVKERTGLPLQKGAFFYQPAGHVSPPGLL
ncbi:hypothetical protein BREVNS_1692 [Brevinematales bacterium NS]|nr:hypothetical protein BREVNS_1692 [Brevinematales bacterium NS]